MDGRAYDLSVPFTSVSGLKGFLTNVVRGKRSSASTYAARERVCGKAADPRFADPKHEDFSLPPDSPAKAIGFEPFSPDDAGIFFVERIS